MKKALPYILYSLVITAAIGMLVYQGLILNDLESTDLTKGVLIIFAAVVGMLRPKRRRKVSNKKALYQNAYKEFIQNAFSDDPKLEKKFYNAVDDYNFNRYAAGISKLTKLRKECTRTADIYAVTVFTALCYDGMELYPEAVAQYEAAASIRPNTTLYSNAGLCCQRMGKYDRSESFYRKALQVDPKNAFAWNNLSALYFRQGDYTQALEYAQKAIEIDPQMAQALSCAAICCSLLGQNDAYEKYYRQAVVNGYDGAKIKNAIRALSTEP